MTVREVVLRDDVRAPVTLSLVAFANRYNLRRTASVIALLVIDTGAVLAGLALVQWGWVAALEAGIAGVVALIAGAAIGLYGLRRDRHSLARIVGAGAVGLVVGVIAASLIADGLTAGSFALLWAVTLTIDIGLRALYDFATGRVLSPHGDMPTAVLVTACAATSNPIWGVHGPDAGPT